MATPAASELVAELTGSDVVGVIAKQSHIGGFRPFGRAADESPESSAGVRPRALRSMARAGPFLRPGEPPRASCLVGQRTWVTRSRRLSTELLHGPDCSRGRCRRGV